MVGILEYDPGGGHLAGPEERECLPNRIGLVDERVADLIESQPLQLA